MNKPPRLERPSRLDRTSEYVTRKFASSTSRRGMLSKLGLVLAAAPAFPLLPIDRKAQAAEPELDDFMKSAQSTDNTQCNYWRYCAISGSLCSCCGGTASQCPPGSKASLTSWVGTCRNPDDGKSYLIAYRDCCGTTSCGRCGCNNTIEATPTYQPHGNNEIIWCFGTDSMTYHCSTAALVGVANL